jgi:hypothetical protein
MKKLFCAIILFSTLAQPVQAHGYRGGRVGAFWGAVAGIALGETLANQYYYSQRYYEPQYYAPPAYVYVQPAPIYAQPVQCMPVTRQILINGYVQNIYSTACLQNGQWVIVQ